MEKQQKTQAQNYIIKDPPKFHNHELLVRLSPSMSRAQHQRLISQSVMEILSDPIVFITDNYYDQNWKQIFPYVQQSYCRKFFARRIGQSTILKEISKVKFLHLKQICLESNQINNIESISMIDMPCVKSILLGKNYIMNVNPLRRGKWKDIEEIELNHNPFIEWRRISEIKSCPGKALDIGFLKGDLKSLINRQDIAYFYTKLGTNILSEMIQSHLQIFSRSGILQSEGPIPQFVHDNGGAQDYQLLRFQMIPMSKKKIESLKRKFNQQFRR